MPAEPWVKIALSDYDRLNAAANAVASGTYNRSLGHEASYLPSSPLLNWATVPDAEDPVGFIRVYGGFLIINGLPISIPPPTTPQVPALAPWDPDPDTILNPDYYTVAVPGTLIERAGWDGKRGFVYWAANDTTDGSDASPWPGKFFVAAGEAEMKTAFSTYRFIQLVAVVLWTQYDDLGYKISQLHTSPIVIAPGKPWDMRLTYSGSSATALFMEGVIGRGGTTVLVPASVEITYAFTGADDVYLALKWNTNLEIDDSAAYEIISGSTRESVTDSEVPEGTPYVKILLYKCVCLGGCWFILNDYREALRGMIAS